MATRTRPRSRRRPDLHAEDDALWYKDAIIYQLHVRSFADSDADGIGDFRGLTDKLDYLQDLGVTAIWLLPFYPSPLRDDGYDIADYMDVNPSYGSLRDFQVLLREAHRRGLRVVTELVLNHTSDQHPWFQRARRARPNSRARKFYVWSDSPDKYSTARIIFKDFETSNWAKDPVADAYYWHRFYSHQPDLNFENPEVHRALQQVLDFWLGMGVDGFRLDAVPYLYEEEGTSCENLPQTHEYLKKVRAHVDANYKNRMLLAEANQWPEDAAAYFGDGDECHMNFHFPLMPRLFMAVHQEDRFPIIDILDQAPAIPENAQWAVFLRNHDELTLEMVTDEDRDYMYRVYAQDKEARINLGIRRRLGPLLGNNRRRIELMNGLLFSLPGAPIIYYGDEIGMGDNIYLGDRNGVRTPMQWSGDRNAGFSRANPQKLFLPVILDPEYHYEAVNVEAQQNNPHSLFWWMKRVIALRKNYRAFGRGSIEFLLPENRKVLAFIRKYENETILVVANLSRFTQYAELDMSAYAGARPVELFGYTEFPRIGELPYFITLGPHAFHWFELRDYDHERPSVDGVGPQAEGRTFAVRKDVHELLKRPVATRFERALPAYLNGRRWFGGKARQITGVEIVDAIELNGSPGGYDASLAFVRVAYVDGEPETYVLPIAFARGKRAERVLSDWPDSILARVSLADADTSAVAFEATADPRFLSFLLEMIGGRKKFKGRRGELVGTTLPPYRRLVRGQPNLDPSVLRAEQSNTSIGYGDTFVLKLFRRPDSGINPDLEIGRFLTEKSMDSITPPVAAFLEYRLGKDEPMTVAALHAFVPNEGDAWSYTLDSLDAYWQRLLSVTFDGGDFDLKSPPSLIDAIDDAPEETGADLIGAYLPAAELLGQRTAALHVALASSEELDFAPESFTPFYQRSVYQSIRSQVTAVFPALKRGLTSLPDDVYGMAQHVLSMEDRVLERMHRVTDKRINSMRIRTHGDYHLGQVLFTGKDFVIIDFEGEPARPLSERRLKRSPLRDVAGMIRSFHYAAYSSLLHQIQTGAVRSEQYAELEPRAIYWYGWVSAAFLRSYLATASPAGFLPEDLEQLGVLLEAFILEKAVYEVGYELNNRPDWLRVPLAGITRLIEAGD
ncbi:MAG TPA: maltose alpha-D-glucosyltransferase [Dehalococcoidia bacterium]|nr:maltose alpha-D-glucosyltransferase [Dehalococcoidia bacterium]